MLSSLFSDPPLAPGTEAPDFTLPDAQGRPVTLSELRGSNVVLVFYPHDNTPVCTKQLCEFRDQQDFAAANDALVFGINDGSANSHAGFQKTHGLPFPLLVDRENRVSRLYNARAPLWVIRTVYLIGKDGLIRYSKRGRPSPHEVLAAAS